MCRFVQWRSETGDKRVGLPDGNQEGRQKWKIRGDNGKNGMITEYQASDDF